MLLVLAQRIKGAAIGFLEEYKRLKYKKAHSRRASLRNQKLELKSA